jgi:hypothetical protein
MVQNKTGGPLVLATAPTGPGVEWQGEGDPTGNDVQICPESMLDSPAFHRALQRGVLEIVNQDDNPELMAKIGLQNEQWAQRIAATEQVAASAILVANNEDIISMPCVGPNSKSTGTCGEPVAVREKEKWAKPALCSQHADLISQYTPTETEESGRRVTLWTRVVIGARQKQDS